jgi:hypothetical protein
MASADCPDGTAGGQGSSQSETPGTKPLAGAPHRAPFPLPSKRHPPAAFIIGWPANQTMADFVNRLLRETHMHLNEFAAPNIYVLPVDGMANS